MAQEDQTHLYEIDLSQGDLFIQLISDDRGFMANQMNRWYELLLDDSYKPIVIPPGLVTIPGPTPTPAPTIEVPPPQSTPQVVEVSLPPAEPSRESEDLRKQVDFLQQQVLLLTQQTLQAQMQTSASLQVSQVSTLKELPKPEYHNIDTSPAFSPADIQDFSLEYAETETLKLSFEQPVGNPDFSVENLPSETSAAIPKEAVAQSFKPDSIPFQQPVENHLTKLSPMEEALLNPPQPAPSSTEDLDRLLDSLMSDLEHNQEPKIENEFLPEDLFEEPVIPILTAPEPALQPIMDEIPFSPPPPLPAPKESHEKISPPPQPPSIDALFGAPSPEVNQPATALNFEDALAEALSSPVDNAVDKLFGADKPPSAPPSMMKFDEKPALSTHAEDLDKLFAADKPPASLPPGMMADEQRPGFPPPVKPADDKIGLNPLDAYAREEEPLFNAAFGPARDSSTGSPDLQKLSMLSQEVDQLFADMPPIRKQEPAKPKSEADIKLQGLDALSKMSDEIDQIFSPAGPAQEPPNISYDFGIPGVEPSDDPVLRQLSLATLEQSPAEAFETMFPDLTDDEIEARKQAQNDDEALFSASGDLDDEDDEFTLQIESLNELIDMAPNATSANDFLMLATYYLSHYQALEKYSLKDLNAQLVRASLTPINHGTLEQVISQGYVRLVPDLTGTANTAEYAITDKGGAYVQSLIHG